MLADPKLIVVLREYILAMKMLAKCIAEIKHQSWKTPLVAIV